mmetsp:Transcript_44420/g.117876  ORF Transcript_44420/g.117876 Transcript_44420/m.117876 type:complete len:128 (-) Transcript_44420:1237-1620(-)
MSRMGHTTKRAHQFEGGLCGKCARHKTLKPECGLYEMVRCVFRTGVQFRKQVSTHPYKKDVETRGEVTTPGNFLQSNTNWKNHCVRQQQSLLRALVLRVSGHTRWSASATRITATPSGDQIANCTTP